MDPTETTQAPVCTSKMLTDWRYFMKDAVSPDIFIDWGFYFLIASALQRRVWLGADGHQLFPNLYVVLVGRPGVGKGLVIRQVLRVLKHHKLNDDRNLKESEKTDEQKLNEAAIAMSGGKNSSGERLLFPVAPDATTYSQLVASLAKAQRFVTYKKMDAKTKELKAAIYRHHTLTFSLEELASLIAKDRDGTDIVNFLQQGYDAGDYDKETKTQGSEHLSNICLNLIAGTNPEFVKECLESALLKQGFASRTIYVQGEVNRFKRLFIPPHNEEQLMCHARILDHVKKLGMLFGPLSLTTEAQAFLTEWWEAESTANRPNTALVLDDYYARKNMHVLKMSMVHHFMDQTSSMLIELDSCKKALETLDHAEQLMHKVLMSSIDSKDLMVTAELDRFIKKRMSVDVQAILLHFVPQYPAQMLLDCLKRGVASKKFMCVKLGNRDVYSMAPIN